MIPIRMDSVRLGRNFSQTVCRLTDFVYAVLTAWFTKRKCFWRSVYKSTSTSGAFFQYWKKWVRIQTHWTATTSPHGWQENFQRTTKHTKQQIGIIKSYKNINQLNSAQLATIFPISCDRIMNMNKTEAYNLQTLNNIQYSVLILFLSQFTSHTNNIKWWTWTELGFFFDWTYRALVESQWFTCYQIGTTKDFEMNQGDTEYLSLQNMYWR